MDFSQALYAIKEGKRIARQGWNGKGMFLELAGPYLVDNGENVRNSLKFIHMKTTDDNYVPWLASQTDLLAEDWEITGQAYQPKTDDLCTPESII